MRHTAVALAALLLLAGCGKSPAAPTAVGARIAAVTAKAAPSARREKAIETFFKGQFDHNQDRNHDGHISADEWMYGADSFKAADTNHDGGLDFAEYLASSDNQVGNMTRTHEAGFKILLSQADRNHDGKIAGKELVYKPNGRKTYDYRPVDFNQDGEFSVDEYVDASWNLDSGLEPATPL